MCAHYTDLILCTLPLFGPERFCFVLYFHVCLKHTNNPTALLALHNGAPRERIILLWIERARVLSQAAPIAIFPTQIHPDGYDRAISLATDRNAANCLFVACFFLSISSIARTCRRLNKIIAKMNLHCWNKVFHVGDLYLRLFLMYGSKNIENLRANFVFLM